MSGVNWEELIKHFSTTATLAGNLFQNMSNLFFRHFPGSVGWPTQREHGIKNFFGAIGGLTLEKVAVNCSDITLSSLGKVA